MNSMTPKLPQVAETGALAPKETDGTGFLIEIYKGKILLIE
jgi:hypothetical protein